MEVELKFGHGRKRLSIPAKARADLLAPAPLPPLADPATAFRAALAAPLGTAPLAGRPVPASVGIAVPDESRPLPVKTYLPLLLEHLYQAFPGLTPAKVLVAVGGGLHPPLDEAGLRQRVPPEIAPGCRVIGHDAKHSPLRAYGTTRRGTPVAINAEYAACELKLVLGMVDPHQFVGFTGGAKGVVVGLAAAATIEKSHGLMFAEGAWVGRLEDNPVRQDMNEQGRLVGVDFVVNFVFDPEKRAVGIWAGEPATVLKAAAEVCARVYGVAIEEPYDLAVVSCGGYPKDLCLYQAQKGLNLASQAVKPGGKLLLLASCDQGVGDEVYYDYVCRFPDPRAAMDEFVRSGFRMGAHKAYLFGLTLTRYQVAIATTLDPGTLGHCHLVPGEAQATLDRWVAEFPGSPRVAVVPNANTTYFYPKNAGSQAGPRSMRL